MATETLVWLLPVPPLVSFFLIVLFTNKNKALSHTIGVGAALLSFIGSMVVLAKAFIGDHALEHLAEHPIGSSINWLQTGDTWFQIGVGIDPLSAFVLFFVSICVLMIFLYSVGYHNFGQPAGDHDTKGLPPHGATVTDEAGHSHTVLSIEPNYSRFFAFISLFAFGMYLLVVSDNLLTLFVGWEVMGLCSYLLIGFWFAKPSARAAAIKAFITTRIGDVFMLIGLAYLYTKAGSLSYSVIFSHETLEMLAEADKFSIFGWSAAAMIGVLLFIGAVGKSAQFPLHIWLPDAMEGPTPVSAMIHAATMVSAGIYMILRIFPILQVGFEHGELSVPMMAMASVGAFTALFAATIAVAQNDIKRVLAYSTISQLGFMVAALGIGAYIAAAFHLVTHAFFKALLFLGSGSVIHGVEHGVLHTGNHDVDPQDMMNMGGLKDKMPTTYWTFLAGGLALSGFPILTAGFWSKDEIFADAWYLFSHEGSNWGLFVLIMLAAAAFLTAFYTMRQITLTFLGKPRTPEAEHAHETPWTMTLPLVVLSIFAIAIGWIGIPEDFLGLDLHAMGYTNLFHGVSYTLVPSHVHLHELVFTWTPLIISVAVASFGLLFGWLTYRNYQAGDVDPVKKWLGGFHTVLENKYKVDELYSATFVRFFDWVSEVFTPAMDRGVIDGILHTVARGALGLGGFFRNKIEDPIITGGADKLADGVQWSGGFFKVIQSGRVQQYMNLVIWVVAIFAVVMFAAQQ